MRKGFTLIELLIVVAIIGILAAIAVPNFLNAQIRAKIARVEADLKSINTAMEMYKLDNNGRPYPRAGNMTFPGRWNLLTSPIAYMNGSVFGDPFLDARYQETNDGDDPKYYYETFWAYDVKRQRFYDAFGHYKSIDGFNYWIGSAGPNGVYNGDSGPAANFCPCNLYFEYDSSNGTISNGDITRLGS
jgi:type II secretion system protein G